MINDSDKLKLYAKRTAIVSGLLFVTGIIGVFFYSTIGDTKKPAFTPEAKAYQEKLMGGYFENGNYIEQKDVVPKKEAKARTGKWSKRGGLDIEVVTNCRQPERLMTVGPIESVQLRHVSFGNGWKNKNRCSYNVAGHANPIYGQKGRVVTRAKFRHDLPFPELPATAVVFYLYDPVSKKKLKADFIKSEGGVIYLKNTSGKKAEVWMVYNYMKAWMEDPHLQHQIGYDGSSAKFIATKYK